jgi:cation diffusion facilitator CzcD-associated flavoprotein CzcO
LESRKADSKAATTPEADVDVIVIGAGVIGIYMLYKAREAGFNAVTLEQADGAGGVWYWNRYPEARFDSESYTYAYLFSKELFDDWHWSELFAGQPEVERYLNHVVDRFDLRRHMHFGVRVNSVTWDDDTATWLVRAADGTELRTHFVVSATGGLSAPYFPDVPGRESFRGISHHTGLWPKEPIDFKGKRVAVVGTGPSGVQVVPAIVDEVASLTVYQRTPNWCTPLNNRPLTDEDQEWLRRDFEPIRNQLNTGVSGFLHVPCDRYSTDDTKEERWAHYEKMWNGPGFSKLGSNYRDMTTNKATNAEFCEFLAEKIRGIVKDPAVADKLIPTDHLYGGKRPPFVSGYFEAWNRPNISLVDVKETPMVRVTETGIETTEGLREFDIIVWATGFDFGVGSLNRMGVRDRYGNRLEDNWAKGPQTYLGFMCHGLPNFFSPGGPHGAGGGNFPRYGNDQVDFITETLVFLREHGFDVIEPPASAQQSFMETVATLAPLTLFSENHSHYYGANIPGKPKVYLLNPMGRAKFRETLEEMVASDYEGFVSRLDDAALEARSG